MFIWSFMILFAAGGVGAITAGVIVFKTDRLGGCIGMVGGIVLLLFGLYPLSGNLYTCEYEPVGDGYYTEKCEIWEP